MHPDSASISNSSLHFILGGSRSGKSAFAEQLASQSGEPVAYVATCRTEGLDPEMQDRLRIHRERRPAHWTTLENQFDLATIASEQAGKVILLDCLTLWASDAMERGLELDAMLTELDHGLAALKQNHCRSFIVSCEIGLGLVPMNAELRRYRDFIGSANQCVARHADQATFMAAGLPMKLK